jgi:hypothetical protein
MNRSTNKFWGHQFPIQRLIVTWNHVALKWTRALEMFSGKIGGNNSDVVVIVDTALILVYDGQCLLIR